MQQNDIDLTLAPASSATVHGTVTDGKSPIANTTVELFGSKGLPFQHTLTDGQGEYSMDGISAGTYSIGAHTEDDGAFAFFDVPDGKYTLRSFADGYLPASPMTVTITGGSIANIPMSMNVDNRTYNGTVSGIIRDNNGLVVAACFVGL